MEELSSLETQKQIVEKFNSFTNWEDRYKEIIRWGKSLPPFDESYKTDDYKVKGCQSNVWLVPEFNDGKVTFKADSDAMIVKGLIAILLKVYSQKTPKEILNTKPEFVEQLGLNTNLSQTRANGLASMIKQIQYYALAYSAVNNNK